MRAIGWESPAEVPVGSGGATAGTPVGPSYSPHKSVSSFAAFPWVRACVDAYINDMRSLPLVLVRVERVQDITEEDARAEGFPAWWEENKREWDDREPNPVDWFAELWDAMYGNWAENPWVWVAEWKEIEVSK